MIKQKFGDRLDGWIQAAFPFLFTRRISPNALTVIGALGSLATGAVFAAGHFAAGGVLMLASGFFDLVDGVVARHQGVSTRFGGFLDSTLDRLADMAVLVGIAVHYAVVGDVGSVALSCAALMAAVLVSYAAACAKLIVPTIHSVGVLERGERVGILAAGAILGFPVVALWVLTLGGAWTVAQRFAQAHREMERLDALERGDAGAAGAAGEQA